MIRKMLIQQLYNDGLDEVAELIERQDQRIAELERKLLQYQDDYFDGELEQGE